MFKSKKDTHQDLFIKCVLAASLLIALWLASCSSSPDISTPTEAAELPEVATLNAYAMQSQSSRENSNANDGRIVLDIVILFCTGSIVFYYIYKRQAGLQMQSDAWRQIASQINATFIPSGPKLQHSYKKWTITLDPSSSRHIDGSRIGVVDKTRFRAPFVNTDGFQFILYPQRFQNWLKWPELMANTTLDTLSATDGDFDPDFIVKTNDTEKVKTLLSNPKVRSLFTQSKLWAFGIIHNKEFESDQSLPPGIYELYLELSEMVTDGEQAKSIFEVFDLMLDILRKSGTASAEDPHFDYGL